MRSSGARPLAEPYQRWLMQNRPGQDGIWRTDTCFYTRYQLLCTRPPFLKFQTPQVARNCFYVHIERLRG